MRTRQFLRLFSASAAVVAATLLAPLATAGTGNAEPLSVRFEAPVAFDAPTAECPEGVARFGFSTLGKSGSATNCLLTFAVVDCPPGVVALFCQELDLLMTLRLHGSEIVAELTLFEIWSCGDTTCAVDQQWPGHVVSAKGRFNKLEGAPVSGGGTLVLDEVGVVSLDEVIKIGED